jgi:hypothetical protein
MGAEMEMDGDGNGVAKSDAGGIPVLALSAADLSPTADEHFALEVADWTAESQESESETDSVAAPRLRGII